MTDLLQLAKISEVTDCDTELYRVGDITGGFDEDLLEKYLYAHGRDGYVNLVSHLAVLQSKVVETYKKTRFYKDLAAGSNDATSTNNS